MMIHNFKKILAPIDFSEPSMKALASAWELAKEIDASELHLLYVVTPQNLLGIAALPLGGREIARESGDDRPGGARARSHQEGRTREFTKGYHGDHRRIAGDQDCRIRARTWRRSDRDIDPGPHRRRWRYDRQHSRKSNQTRDLLSTGATNASKSKPMSYWRMSTSSVCIR
jgi:hypothetical protein